VVHARARQVSLQFHQTQCANGFHTENAVSLYGPYKESFTGSLVINLSSRKGTTTQMGHGLTMVAAADILLSELETIVGTATYEDEGFGAILSYSSNEVLVWNGTNKYNDDTDSFLFLSQVDAELESAANSDFNSTTTIEYTDADGTEWIVGSVPFFESTNNQFGLETSYSFVMLVFQKKVWIDLREECSQRRYLLSVLFRRSCKLPCRSFNPISITLWTLLPPQL
jgi:hypothetical protein